MNDIRKERTREMYIDIVCDLISKEGMSAVSIRTISEKAGYNSATLYSYFEKLPDLVLCAQLRFEEQLVSIFKTEIDTGNVTSYYEVWPHMYAVMVKYYLENPNIFDCAFVSNIAGNEQEKIRAQRQQVSNLQKYVFESLGRIAKEIGKSMDLILRVNDICLAQVTGMVLLYTKRRIDTSHPLDIKVFEHQLRSIITCFMEEMSYER